MTIGIVSGHVKGNDTSSVTSHVVTLPSYTAGDILIIVFGTDEPGDTITAPAGWSTLYANTSVASEATASIFYKTAASEPSTVTVTTGAGERGAWIAFAVTGAGAPDVYPSAGSGSGATATAPAITSIAAGALRISAVVTDRESTPHGTASGGHTKLDEISFASAVSVSVHYKALGGAGLDAAATVSITSEQWAAFSFTLPPSVTGVEVAPAAAAAAATAAIGAIVHGSLTLQPTAGAAAATAATGAIVLGSTAATPAAATAAATATIGAVVIALLPIAPSAATAATTATIGGVVLGSLLLESTTAASVASAVGPTIVLGSVALLPDSAQAAASSGVGSVILGAISIAPAAANIVASAAVGRVKLGGATIILTLQARSVALTLKQRGIMITLSARSAALTLGDRPSVITLPARTTLLTIKGR